MTSSGLLMPPDQKASQTRSILLFSSPVITDETLLTGSTPDWDIVGLPSAVPASPGQQGRFADAADTSPLGQLADRVAESVLAGADVVVEDGGELVAEVLGDHLPWFAELVVEPLGRRVVAEVAVDDRLGPGVVGIVLVDPMTDPMP